MKNLFVYSIAAVAAIGSAFTAFSKVESKTDVKAEYRVMANDGNCYNNPYDCADTVIIVAPKKELAAN